MITIKSTGGTSPMIVQQPAGGKVLKLERWGVFVMVRTLVEFIIPGGYDNVKKR